MSPAVGLRPLLLPATLLLAGCGATTARVALTPTLDSAGRAGFESTFSLGIGTPLDFAGRSHHYLQELSSVGGGVDGATRAPMFVAGQALDYIRWAEPRLDLRAGTHFTFRDVNGASSTIARYGLGAHLAILPMVFHDDSSWLVSHLCVGPELRAEAVWSAPTATRGLFSLPLLVEWNFLAAAD